MNKNIAIYRCCEAETHPSQFKHIRPEWFCKKKSFKSFWESAQSAGCEVKILHDGDDGELLRYIRSITNIIPHKIRAKSNLHSLMQTFDMASDAFNNGYDNVYFIEDDYLHTTEAVDVIFKAVENFKLVTGFDHLDRYIRNDDISFGKEYIAFSTKTNRHWRTAESTTCTWACTKSLWNDYLEDAARKHALEDRKLFRDLYNNNIRLWTPIPGVSTTIDINTFSPGINWARLNMSIDTTTPNSMLY